MLHFFKINLLFFPGLTIFLFASVLNAASPAISGPRILYINSCNSAGKWSGGVLHGFREQLLPYAPDTVLDMADLNCRNLKDFQADPENLRHLKTILQNKRYDLILAVGNPAADLFLDKKLLPSPQTAVVFCGYDASGKEMKPLPPRTAGLLLPSRLLPNIEFGLKLFPKTGTVAILTGAEPEEIRMRQETAKASARFPGVRFQWINGNESSIRQMLSTLKTLPENSFVILDDRTASGSDMPVPPASGWKQIRETYPGPVLCSSDNIPGEKILGGVMTSGNDHGREAAMLAIRLLAAGDTSVQQPLTGTFRYVMHYPSMKKYGIDPGRLPKDTLFLDPPGSAWHRYHPFLFLALAALMLSYLIFSVVSRLNKQLAQRRQKIIYDALPVRIVVVDANGKICYYQVHRKDSHFNFAPKNLNDFTPAAQAVFREPIRKVLETGESLNFNYTLEGRRRHVEFQRLPKNIFGVRSVLWISTDIDELENARKEMARLAERFQLTLRSIGEAVLVTDEEGKITLVNAAAEKLTGYAPEELIGQALSEKIILAEYGSPKEDRTSVLRKFMTGQNAEPVDHMDLISKDGSRRHIEGSLTPILNFPGERTGSVMVFRDMTEEYERQNRIFTQKNLLEAAADFAGIAYFRLDNTENRILVLQNREKFWETSSNDFPASAKEWVHPDDLPDFKKEWNALFQREKDSLHLVYRGGKDGRYRYFEMRCRKTVNPENSQEEFFGLIRDIDEEKTAELALGNANQLIQSVMDHIPCLLYVKDFEHEDRYLFISNYFLQQIGLTADFVIGKTDCEIFRKEIADAYRLADRQVMESKQELNYLEPVISSDGVTHTMQTRKLCLERKTGNLLLGISFDITDLINHRNELQNYAQQEKMINTCLQTIMLIEDDEEALQTALRHACEYFNATNCYIVTYNYETARVVPFHEYVSPGNVPLLDPGVSIPLDLDDPWRRNYEKHNFFLADRADAPDVFTGESIGKSFIIENGIKSFAFNGIWLEKKLWGSFGVLFKQDYHTFTQQDKSALSALTNMIEIILERRKKRSDLTRSEFEKRLIMDTIRIPILLLDPDLNLVRTNNAALNIIGKTEKEIYADPAHYMFCLHMDSSDDCPARLARADGQVHSREILFSGRNYLLSAYPILYEKKLIYILNTLIDISDSKAIQQQLTRALMEAQNAAKAKSFFLATISHELRTPLNAVIGFSELLQKDSLSSEEQKDALESIHYAGNALLNLINNVLDLSKIESEQMNIVPQPTHLQKLIEEVASIFRYKAEEKKLSFILQYPPDLPVLILDTLRLRQILLNLVGNAFKFTHKGSVTLSAAFRDVNPENRRGDLVITVCDTGIGIAGDSQKKIFMPFVQQYAARDANVYKGTGLGLAISQRLAHCMGGSIQLESEAGKGSSFTLTLPSLEYEIPQQEKTTLPERFSSMELNHAPKKVLLVDDVPMNLKVLAAMLKQLGFETRTAASGKEALEQIGQDPPDLVLTDLWMPGMGGVELLEAIRKENRFRHMLIVAITADTEADKNFSLRCFNGILLKPVTLDKLKNFLVSLADALSFPQQNNPN
ncbi:MAG: Aerobic respiration control sensor protein ArcB [Lentisphaerae bacterium ADurb.Bin242]|nr:MAG: Aerobic respiration control sensor protein ArcB [Lentisphaerae bacterium ADurb.Bin242]